ncbi:MAG: pyridoxal-phosphate dependent enzyme [Candidatus Limnocylindrales bacterium]
MTGAASRLVCAGCGAEVPPATPIAWMCPAARDGDDIDHVLQRVIEPEAAAGEPDAEPSANPFLRYRRRFHSYQVARAVGWSDGRYVETVSELDEAIARVDGTGFRATPLVRSRALEAELGFGPSGGVFVKDETGNVSGSHKARHLMGVMLALKVAESIGIASPDAPLAIASCGNAALAAAVVARAAGRRLLVFVPTSADPVVVDRLGSLEAELGVCERAAGQSGDPTVGRLMEAIAEGAVPFTVQGNLNGLAIEGGQTLAWELVDQLRDDGVVLDRLVIHVGGGAFASSAAQALEESAAAGDIATVPTIDTVQTKGGYPLRRAHERTLEHLQVPAGTPVELRQVAGAISQAVHHRSDYMWAWETEPVSVAHGILDDETYDWAAVVRAMLITGGRSLVVDEATLEAANALARPLVGIDADHTGTAGLAGLIQLTRDGLIGPDENAAVIFSGARRASDAHSS